MKKAIRTFLSLLFSCMLAIGLYQLYSVWKEYEAGDALYVPTPQNNLPILTFQYKTPAKSRSPKWNH